MPLPTNRKDDYILSGNKRRPIPSVVPLNERGVKQFIALYYGLVAEVDHYIGKLIDSLSKNNLLEKQMSTKIIEIRNSNLIL